MSRNSASGLNEQSILRKSPLVKYILSVRAMFFYHLRDDVEPESLYHHETRRKNPRACFKAWPLFETLCYHDDEDPHGEHFSVYSRSFKKCFSNRQLRSASLSQEYLFVLMTH